MNSNPGKHYDVMGDAYIRKNESDVHNAYYNNPAIKTLLSEVESKKVLDVGCGGGVLTEWLISESANVIAFDISEKMVEYTKKRVGSKAEVRVADLSNPLDFLENDSIDIIIASLVLHYVNKWLPVFKEFERILNENGVIVISVHHPHADWKWFNRPNYFKKELYEDTWNIEGKSFTVKFYHRTFANMHAIFRKFGFYVDALLEPFPVKEAKEIDPKSYEQLLTNPQFLFLRLKKLKNGEKHL